MYSGCFQSPGENGLPQRHQRQHHSDGAPSSTGILNGPPRMEQECIESVSFERKHMPSSDE